MTAGPVRNEQCGRLADANEIAAVTSWAAAIQPAVRAAFGVNVEQAGGALALFVPATGTAFLNRVLGLGVAEPATRSLVSRLVAEYRRLGTAFMVHLAPYARPAELPRWLADEGLRPGPNWLVLYRGDHAVAARERPSPVVVRPAVAGDAEVFAETLCAGYGMPVEWAPLYRGFVASQRWRHLLALDGDQVVGTCSLFRNGRSAWLGNSATLAARRGRGVQTTLNGARLRDGLAAGCAAFTGETWQPGDQQRNQSLRNHLRDGWVMVHVRGSYATSLFGQS